MLKRSFDFVVAALLLLVAAPLMVIVAAIVRIFMGRDVLFTQIRPGHHGTPFYVYKFRTMTSEKDESGDLLPDAARLNKVGLFLRSSSLDELPQLFNVLRGDISLVGPRPLLMEYLPLYSKAEARRHDVRPGITGWAQVNGRNSISWKQKFELDIWYVDNQSFLLDIKILFLTAKKVLARSEINSGDHATMTRFVGTDHTDNNG